LINTVMLITSIAYFGDVVLTRRYTLSKRDRKELLESLRMRFPNLEISKDSVIEILHIDKSLEVIIIDRVPALIRRDNEWLPHLKFLLKHGIKGFPWVAVDKGAVKPILNGADVMAPGVKAIGGSFRENDIVIVVDNEFFKPIMVGRALVDSEKMKSISRGKVIENIHVLNDDLWNIV